MARSKGTQHRVKSRSNSDSVVPASTMDIFHALLYSLCMFFTFCFMQLLQYLCDIAEWFENFIVIRYTAITRRIHVPKNNRPLQFTPSISFMGGGQLWMFAIGAGHYIYENYDIEKIKFMASSCGCFAAVPLACGLDPYEWCKNDWGKCIEHFESRGMIGCLFDTKHFYYDLWEAYLPQDAHIRLSGRLFISVTLFPSMRNKVVSKFDSREELIWTIVASMCLPYCFIRDWPVQCGPEVGLAIDGGFSNDAPCLDSYTITVSALHKKADIIPSMGVIASSADDDYYDMSNATSTTSRPRLDQDEDDDDGDGDDSDDGASNGQRVDSDVETTDNERGENDTDTDGEVPDDNIFARSRRERDIADDRSKRIRALDIIRVPKYSRVWEIGAMAERASAKCPDFNRHEWVSIRKLSTLSSSLSHAAKSSVVRSTTTSSSITTTSRWTRSSRVK
jgi:hypothetical protein